MKTAIQDRRLRASVRLRELSKAMGPGFSVGKLSMAERALIQVPAHEERIIIAAIVDRRNIPFLSVRRPPLAQVRKVWREINFTRNFPDMTSSNAKRPKPVPGDSSRNAVIDSAVPLKI